MKSLLFFLSLPLMAAPSVASFEVHEPEPVIVTSPMMAADAKEEEADPALEAWIGGGLVATAGLGAGVTIFNNNRRVMNEPQKDKKEKKNKRNIE